uniref:Uncharacterized protein n=1 Tax=Meloidogyne incognita TaxID=6306 RepID=A0A914KKY0_MELIC
MILCELIPLVHASRGLAKQAEDEQVFVFVFHIRDFPCFGFEEGVFLWEADSITQKSEGLSIHVKSVAGVYLHIEGRTATLARSVPPTDAFVLIFSN